MLALLKVINLPQASTMAASVDRLYDVIFYFCAASFIVVIGALIFFSFFYHRRRNHPELTPYIEGHMILETSVIVGLFIAVMVFFYWGWLDYKKLIAAPPHSMEINVTGRQWLWEFEYPNGRKMANEVVVPKGQPVRFIMGSMDVLHSFYVPDFRIKQDVVPGTYTSLWFNASQAGEHQVFCAEYCGTAHSKMLAKVKVLEPEDYEKWQRTWEWEKQLGLSPSSASEAKGAKETAGATPVAALTPVERGQKVFSEKGCTACHTVTGQVVVGPSLKGIFGHEVELEGDKKVTVDENYIRESLMDPQAKLVKGFQPVMPTFRGTLSDDEINSLVAYIKSLSN